MILPQFIGFQKGNAPTSGLLIHAIGEADRMWVGGSEPAFTLIPNFLVTGIVAIIVSLAIIVWSIGFLHKKHGPLVFLLLFVLLFLVGGGIGQVIFFTLCWAFSTRINKPLTWWTKVLPLSLRRVLAKTWHLCLIASSRTSTGRTVNFSNLISSSISYLRFPIYVSQM
jgi:hypothetical protein